MDAKNNFTAPLLLLSIKLSLIPTGVLYFQRCQTHAGNFFSPFTHRSFFLPQRGRWRFRLFRLSPDGGLWKALNCLQNVPWRMWNDLLLCCSLFFFSFNLTISLSLSPDCIRIGCNLSKCLLWLWFYLLYHDLGTCSVPLLPHEREYNSFILPHNCLCLLLLLSSSQASV